MSTDPHKASLSTIAIFPKGTFLEKLAVRSDNSLLVSSLKAREVWYVPPAQPGERVDPKLLFRFDQSPMSFVEPERDILYVCTSDGYATHASNLYPLTFATGSLETR